LVETGIIKVGVNPKISTLVEMGIIKEGDIFTLYGDKGTVTREGILFNGIYYNTPSAWPSDIKKTSRLNGWVTIRDSDGCFIDKYRTMYQKLFKGIFLISTPYKFLDSEQLIEKKKRKSDAFKVKLVNLLNNKYLKPGQEIFFKKCKAVLVDGGISYKHNIYTSPNSWVNEVLKDLDYSNNTRCPAWDNVRVGSEEGKKLSYYRELYLQKK
jgi:hypothetical protein